MIEKPIIWKKNISRGLRRWLLRWRGRKTVSTAVCTTGTPTSATGCRACKREPASLGPGKETIPNLGSRSSIFYLADLANFLNNFKNVKQLLISLTPGKFLEFPQFQQTLRRVMQLLAMVRWCAGFRHPERGGERAGKWFAGSPVVPL